jgi:hypothetical protein
MAIDSTGEWYRGDTFADLAEFLQQWYESEYPVASVARSVCQCGGTLFHVFADDAEGVAQRVCASCGAESFLADSDEFWDETEPEQVFCSCGHDSFEVGIGFSMRKSEPDEVKWITVGVRCGACGILASPVDWKSDFLPSQHLLSRA